MSKRLIGAYRPKGSAQDANHTIARVPDPRNKVPSDTNGLCNQGLEHNGTPLFLLI